MAANSSETQGWQETEYWIHVDDLRDTPNNQILRESIRSGKVGLIEFCAVKQREQLDKVDDVLAKLALGTKIIEEVI